MKLPNFFKKKELKSFPTVNDLANSAAFSSNTATLILNSKGEVIDTSFTTDAQEIAQNGSINTIISKHSSIVNEAELTVKENSESSDVKTTNKDALQFLEWLNYPNSIPSPQNKYEILKYIFNAGYKRGLAGLIYTFDGDESFENWENIRLAKTIVYNYNDGKPKYSVNFNEQKTYDFYFDSQKMNFICKTSDGKLLFLVVFGNFSIEKGQYVSIFKDIVPYIRLQNHLINFAESFHREACFPSQIVQITYKGLEPGKSLNSDEQKQFKDAVESVKSQIMKVKGSVNAGNLIVPNSPHLEIDIKPLSIPTNATDNIAYQNMVSDKIYSFVDGGSSAAFEGKSEYSNNASAKLQEIYDGAFRTAKSIIIEPLNIFMRSLLLLNRSKVEQSKLYFSFNISSVQIYQKQEKAEIVQFVQNNLLKLNEGRKRIAKVAENYGDLGDTEGGDVFFKELSGKDPSLNKQVI